jgi:hypothetical protein
MEANMNTTTKLAGLSALMAAAFVSVFMPMQGQPAAASGKLYVDRVGEETASPFLMLASTARAAEVAPASTTSGRADRIASAAPDCAAQTWPYVAGECLSGAPTRKVRTITVEQREATGSTLVRMPVQATAAR